MPKCEPEHSETMPIALDIRPRDPLCYLCYYCSQAKRKPISLVSDSGHRCIVIATDSPINLLISKLAQQVVAEISLPGAGVVALITGNFALSRLREFLGMAPYIRHLTGRTVTRMVTNIVILHVSVFMICLGLVVVTTALYMEDPWLNSRLEHRLS